MKYHLHILYNQKNVGDQDQSRGVAQELKKMILEAGHEVAYAEIEENIFPIVEQEADPSQIIITAGDHGLIKLSQIKDTNPHLFSINTIHQWPEKIEIKHYPSVMGLPKTESLPLELKSLSADKKVTLIRTNGVPHGVTDASVATAVRDYKGAPLPDLTGKQVIACVIAGDAPNRDSKQIMFTPKDARLQARLMFNYLLSAGKLSKDTTFLITDGWRTGKHNYEDQQELKPNPHEIATEVNAVSAAYLDELYNLLEANKLSKDQVHFYEFKKISGTVVSAYLPILDAIAKHKGIYFTASESTSMVTQSEYIARHGGEVIVYRPSSESESHKANLDYQFSQGLCTVLESDGNLKKPTQTYSPSPSAAYEVAKAAFELLQPKVIKKKSQDEDTSAKALLSLSVTTIASKAEAKTDATDQKGKDVTRDAVGFVSASSAV